MYVYIKSIEITYCETFRTGIPTSKFNTRANLLQNPYLIGLSTSKSRIYIESKMSKLYHCFGNLGMIIFIITNGDNNFEIIALQKCYDPL